MSPVGRAVLQAFLPRFDYDETWWSERTTFSFPAFITPSPEFSCRVRSRLTYGIYRLREQNKVCFRRSGRWQQFAVAWPWLTETALLNFVYPSVAKWLRLIPLFLGDSPFGLNPDRVRLVLLIEADCFIFTRLTLRFNDLREFNSSTLIPYVGPPFRIEALGLVATYSG